MGDGFEQRGSLRVPAEYDVEYAIPGAGTDGIGRSVDLSESGLRFVCQGAIAPGSHVTVRLPPRRRGVPALLRFASVVRCMQLDDGSGFAVGCAYD